ncbi:hypothetical protein [Tardiphaga sp.]|uniref:hypothetical protein n=1 Tax=Tardiphaga sp. TaxID=1926292 RepID=UPI00352B7478
MATNKEIEAGAKSIAEDLALPGGRQKKLARVVENYLDWFDAAEARGLTLNDMIGLLFAAGAKGRNGRPISIGTLSSAIWRKRRKSQAPVPATRTRSKTRATPARRDLKRGTGGRSDLADDKPPTPATADKASRMPKKRPPVMGPAPPAPRLMPKVETRRPPRSEAISKSETLAFMKRAASIRRTRND